MNEKETYPQQIGPSHGALACAELPALYCCSWLCYAVLEWTIDCLIVQRGCARMAVAAVTPRVRTIVICDDVSASLTEDGVFTLEGVRLHLEAASFPCRAALSLFLLLSSPRKGRYSGKILIVNERNDRPIRYVKFFATFQDDNELLPLYVEVGDCVFPGPGQYSFEIYFSTPDGGDAMKGEHPFSVFSHEE